MLLLGMRRWAQGARQTVASHRAETGDGARVSRERRKLELVVWLAWLDGRGDSDLERQDPAKTRASRGGLGECGTTRLRGCMAAWRRVDERGGWARG